MIVSNSKHRYLSNGGYAEGVDPRGSGLLFFMFIRPQPYTCLGIECAVSRRSSDTHTRFSVRTVARQTRGRRARRRGAAESRDVINESEFTGGVMAYAMAPRTCVIHPALRPWRPGIRPGYRLEIRTSGFRVPVIRLPARTSPVRPRTPRSLPRRAHTGCASRTLEGQLPGRLSTRPDAPAPHGPQTRRRPRPPAHSQYNSQYNSQYPDARAPEGL